MEIKSPLSSRAKSCSQDMKPVTSPSMYNICLEVFIVNLKLKNLKGTHLNTQQIISKIQSPPYLREH